MERSEVDICNAALGHCLQPAIHSLDEPNDQARYCEMFYATARDATLRKFDWSCARSHQIGVPVEWISNVAWSYAYYYPPDILAVRAILPVFAKGPRVPYQLGKLAAPSEARVIFTNMAPATIVVTEAIVDPAFFDALLADVIALDLATRIVLPLTKKRDLLQAISQSRQLAYHEAMTVCMNEEVYDGDVDAPWTAVR